MEKHIEGEHSYKVLPAASKNCSGFNMHINDKQGRHISDINEEKLEFTNESMALIEMVMR